MLTESNYVGEIETALTDLLVAAKANNMSDMPTEKIVRELVNMGYNVDLDSIMDVLSGNPFVQVATKDSITLKDSSAATTSGDAPAAETNRDKVKAMAQKAAARTIG